MDPSEYLPSFLAESREHLQELNVAIVALEQNPGDAGGIDAIFRAVHSVKGMAGTMGFTGIAELSHEMEAVFELVRQRRGAVARETVDVVLECVDALAAAVDAIERDGEERIDSASLIPRLRALVRAPDARPAPSQTGNARVLEASRNAPGAVIAQVEFAPEILMPSVHAYVLLTGLRERGTVLASSPPEEELDGWDGRTVEVLCGADFERADIEAVLAATEGIASVSFRTPALTGEPLASEQAPPAAPVVELTDQDADDFGLGAPRAAASRIARTVRVDAERLDQLMHYMGELVVHRTQLAALVEQADVPGIGQAMQQLERTSQALRAMVMKVRMVQVEVVFSRLPRLIRDVAGELGKEVVLQLSGADTELDRTVVDALGDPLVHLVRNAIDHGLEPAAERIAAGKPPSGVLKVSARHAGGGVVITVRDDGRGVNAAEVSARARERGLIGAADELTVAAATDLLFTPGFSTARQMSEISGRGVGMDAARAAVRALGGDVVIQSEAGVGTTAEIHLPLTLAITSALLVEVGGLPFAIPLDRVERTLALAGQNVRQAAGQQLLVLPERVVPLHDAARLLTATAGDEPEHAVIVRAGDELLALAVGELIGQGELLTRPLPPELETSRPVAAGAVLAEGGIALIVDCDALPAAISKELAASAIAA
jgi:two-component system chemotaxis sensor kinase CheA